MKALRKIGVMLIFVILAFMFVACGSQDQGGIHNAQSQENAIKSGAEVEAEIVDSTVNLLLMRCADDALSNVDSGNSILGLTENGTIHIVERNESQFAAEVQKWTDIVKIVSSGSRVMGLRSNGTVLGVSIRNGGVVKVPEDWTDIVDIRVGGYSGMSPSGYYAGLKSDGTVVSEGLYLSTSENIPETQVPFDAEQWTNITQLTGSLDHLVGLRSDGTVIAAGENKVGQCEVLDWSDIKAVYAMKYITVGLRNDGTVVGTGLNGSLASAFIDWTDIIDLGFGYNGADDVIGLKADGSVISRKYDKAVITTDEVQCGVKKMLVGQFYIVALKTDGTLISLISGGGRMDFKIDQDKINTWTDVTEIYGLHSCIVAVQSDGTILTSGYYGNDKELSQAIASWDLFSLENLNP